MSDKSLYHVEVNLDNISHNIKSFCSLVGDQVSVMSVVKSNAYGHGIVEVSKTVLKSGASFLGVVTIDEALYLRENGINEPILVLGFGEVNKYKQAILNDVSISIYSLDFAKKLSNIASDIGKKANVHIKVDTGMNRMGLLSEDVMDMILQVNELNGVYIEGVYTHLADAENPEAMQAKDQLNNFEYVLSLLKKNDISIKFVHAGASAATLLIPSSRFNMVRIGISTYGMWPSLETREASLYLDWLKDFELKPALSFKTVLVEKKKVKAGSLIGYGGTYRTRKDTMIGVLPVGYAEGYDRRLSNCGEVLIGGKRAPVIGNVCMNMVIVDLSEVLECEIGDEVVLIGRQGDEEVTTDEIAKKNKTINYNVTTCIPEKVSRYYKRNNK